VATRPSEREAAAAIDVDHCLAIASASLTSPKVRAPSRETPSTVSTVWTVRAELARESATRASISPMSAAVRSAASAELAARRRTSPATTAKPCPCSPARAASIAALSARSLL
jgi:hypothetical protein